jgi:SAM-dependent methyltransferase
MLRDYVRRLKGLISLLIFKFRRGEREKFECPICGYIGPFMEIAPATGFRKHAKCPSCNALERHRLQYLVVSDVLRDKDTAHMKILHFAPEPFFRAFFSQRFGQYESADLERKDVDHIVDLQRLPFVDATYDFVFASHVLEHVPDDERAIAEIRRILKPNVIAILPVPLVRENTVEYPEPNPRESYHVRAPGLDYFDRYERHFTQVERRSSDSLPAKYQLYVYENRSQRRTKESYLRPAMESERFSDIVPICYV